MKKRLLILSDLWGKEKSDWLEQYLESLKTDFEIQYYDCCALGNVDKLVYEEERLHQQFVNGGIETAVQQLLHLEKTATTILAFSVGGVIAWKFATKTPKIKALYLVSATRLRKATEKPANTKIALYFGKKDAFTPQSEWFQKMELRQNLLAGEGHEVYKEKKFAAWLCQEILKTSETF